MPTSDSYVLGVGVVAVDVLGRVGDHLRAEDRVEATCDKKEIGPRLPLGRYDGSGARGRVSARDYFTKYEIGWLQSPSPVLVVIR